MNCHGNGDDNNEKSHGKGIFSHGILMLLCCLTPILLLLVLPRFNIKSPALQSILSGGAFLLCPLMHIGMMFFMGKGNKKENKDRGEIQ
jgi:hypothetical protein